MACRLREYASAFGWLGWALDRHPGDMHLRARVGYLQLAIGDLNAAADTFKVAQLHHYPLSILCSRQVVPRCWVIAHQCHTAVHPGTSAAQLA